MWHEGKSVRKQVSLGTFLALGIVLFIMLNPQDLEGFFLEVVHLAKNIFRGNCELFLLRTVSLKDFITESVLLRSEMNQTLVESKSPDI